VRPLAGAVIALVMFSGCGGGSISTPGNPTSPPTQFDPVFAKLADREVRQPDVSGSDCPVTPSALISPTLPMTVGDGPVYTTGLGSETVMNLTPVSGSKQWEVGILQWIEPPSSTGKAIVRARQFGDSTPIGFGLTRPAFSEPARLSVELDPSVELPRPSDEWFSWSARVFLTQPGCYFLQIDSEQAGTQTIIFKAQ
jgi:hypothetical protein